jgi:hypothetical protein
MVTTIDAIGGSAECKIAGAGTMTIVPGRVTVADDQGTA